MEALPIDLPRKARRATGWTGGVLQDRRQAPVCTLWKGLSTLRFGAASAVFTFSQAER